MPQEPYSDEDLRHLFAAAGRRERDLCLLLLLTGLRAAELVSLACTAAPRSQSDVASIVGKGGRWGRVVLPFPVDGVVPRSYGILYRTLRELGLRAGVHCTARRFRVTYCHLLLATNDLETVRVAMRHFRLETTAHYGRWGAEGRALDAQRELAERVLGAL